jgi:hypothetical protein
MMHTIVGVMPKETEEAATLERFEALIAAVDARIDTLRLEAGDATEEQRAPIAKRLERLENRREWLLELIAGTS